MAFDPALYNLISIKDLATAFNPDKGWVLAIQDPSGAVTTKLTAEQLGILLNGNIQLPDGVLSGLDVNIGNATNPKTVSVSPGQYRINNGVYDLNAQYNANINAPGTIDRTDAILADDIGDVYYQANYNGVAVDGTIVVTTFLVPADGSDINPAPVIPAQYAVMNANNVGDLTVTSQGDFQPEIFVALANINNASKYAIKNTSSGDFATAGYAAENDLGRKIHLLITSSGHANYGLLPDRAYLLTNGAMLDVIAPQLLLNGVPITAGGGGIPPLEFNEADLVDQGDGFWKLPITLEENEGINWIKVTIGVNSFFKPITLNDDLSFITDFETNTTQTIKVKKS